MEQGYIKLFRSINGNDLIEYDNACYIVFLKLLTRVDRFSGTYRTGRNRLASICNLKPSTVRDALKRLEAATMIRQQPDSRATTIYICNWSKYQQDDDSRTTLARRQSDTKQEERRRSIDTNVSMSNSDELDVAHRWICALFGKNPERFKLSTQRRQKLKARLKELGKERFKQAYTALSQSEFHRGANDRGWSVDKDPYWLLQSYERAEMWADDATAAANIDLTKVEIDV